MLPRALREQLGLTGELEITPRCPAGRPTPTLTVGTNEPTSIGPAASRGCVRMFDEDSIEPFKVAPRTGGAQHVEDGVDDPAAGVLLVTAGQVGRGRIGSMRPHWAAVRPVA